MAVYPCTFESHRYPQKQRSVYVSDVGSARPQTKKHRVCARHLEEILRCAQRYFTFIDEDSQMSMECEVCGKPRETGLFLKIYAEDGEEPAQYAVDVCPEHRGQLLEDLRWRNMLAVGAGN